MADFVEGAQHVPQDSELPLTHVDLQTSLVDKSLAPYEFVQALFDLDQKNKDIETYEANIQLLENPEVKEIIMSCDDPYAIHSYLDKIAFFRYHQAQIKAGNKDLDAAQAFEKALDDKERAKSYLKELLTDPKTDEELRNYISHFIDENKGDGLFVLYMQANAAYMRGNTEKVKEIHKSLSELAPDQPNTIIVGNLLKGLQGGQGIDYQRDHHLQSNIGVKSHEQT